MTYNICTNGIGFYVIKGFAFAIILSSVGFPLLFVFLKPYNELQNFESNYIDAVCVAGLNFKFEYKQNARSVHYTDINVYIPNSNGSLDYKFNTYVQRPSSSYYIVLSTKSNVYGKKHPNFKNGTKCLVSNTFYGVGIISIDYSDYIRDIVYAGSVFSSIACLLYTVFIIYYICYAFDYLIKKFYSYKHAIKQNEYNSGNQIIITIPEFQSINVDKFVPFANEYHVNVNMKNSQSQSMATSIV